jgi:hypothetical protein
MCTLADKNENTDFLSYFSNQRLFEHGFAGRKAGPVREALSRIQRNGNATKHHEIATSFDGQQLANDLATITPLLIKVANSIASKKIAGRGRTAFLVYEKIWQKGA